MVPYAILIVLDEEWMKREEAKERWRGFIKSCVYLPISHLMAVLPVAPLTPKTKTTPQI